MGHDEARADLAETRRLIASTFAAAPPAPPAAHRFVDTW
jgi:hypothetical protein